MEVPPTRDLSPEFGPDLAADAQVTPYGMQSCRRAFLNQGPKSTGPFRNPVKEVCRQTGSYLCPSLILPFPT